MTVPCMKTSPGASRAPTRMWAASISETFSWRSRDPAGLTAMHPARVSPYLPLNPLSFHNLSWECPDSTSPLGLSTLLPSRPSSSSSPPHTLTQSSPYCLLRLPPPTYPAGNEPLITASRGADCSSLVSVTSRCLLCRGHLVIINPSQLQTFAGVMDLVGTTPLPSLKWRNPGPQAPPPPASAHSPHLRPGSQSWPSPEKTGSVLGRVLPQALCLSRGGHRGGPR